MTLVKICGLRSRRDVELAVESGADMVGMVLSPGFRRSVGPEDAASMSDASGDAVAVGVFVDAPSETVVEAVDELGLGAVQLHGSEDDEYVSCIRSDARVTVVKSFVVKGSQDVEAAKRSSADLVLLDGGMGTGTGFDLSLVGRVGRRFLLAGGLDPQNVRRAMATVHPYAVDVSSGVETGGVKDPVKMREFVESVREADMSEAKR
ncbi:MAG: phosphoribosylanthranilate isomerase [Candidatus Methanomethylophilaceae archaeon]|nr:phosphoribosylanthranilate isomerase [Candidatus Methanomethylophilaceae archaeon]